ncbi:site-specific integrase [Azospirillum sp. A26]|uniref:tyrosine-type recombinase/integrase n=1 Tax=Azospirillum sp. A26 TaxID=3160607 RepID=UPI00366A919D
MPRRNKGPHLHFDERRQVWYIRWFENGKARVRSTTTGDRRRAESELARHLSGSNTGPSDPAARKISDLLTDFITEHIGHLTHPDRVIYAVERLGEWWGERTVDEITERECRAYGAWRGSGKSRRAVTQGAWGNELAVLNTAVKHDWRHRRLSSLVPVWVPPRPEPRTRWLTRDEVAALLRAARSFKRIRSHLPLFILIGLYTGARKEAILSLRWPQVDLARGVIDFNIPGRAKTSKGRAVIPIPRRLMTFLKAARKKGSDTGHVITYQGHPVKTVKGGWAYARKRAGLGPDVIPHTLRHTAASWMVQKGVPLYEVARWLGHKTISQVQSTYGHLAPDHLDRARRALDRA